MIDESTMHNCHLADEGESFLTFLADSLCLSLCLGDEELEFFLYNRYYSLSSNSVHLNDVKLTVLCYVI